MARALLLMAGAALVVCALVWRARVVVALRRDVAAGLGDPDPTVRSAVLWNIGGGGLKTWAPVLLARIEAGLDDDLAAQLVELVGVNQWEPADDPALVELRLWATQWRRRHADGHDRGSPPPSEPPAAPSSSEPAAASSGPPDVRPPLVAAVEEALGGPVTWLRFVPCPPASGQPGPGESPFGRSARERPRRSSA